MSARFDAFIPFILEWETTYAKGHHGDDAFVVTEHDPDDSGGATRYGVDKSSHRNVDVEHLTRAGAIAIYQAEWDAEGCEKMAAKLGEAYYNCCVNCGVGRAKKLLALAKGSAGKFLDQQAAFYHRLVEARPVSQKYLAGWLNRVNALRTYLSLG